MENDAIRQVLLDYRSGKIDKYEAMDALDLDRVSELLKLMARHGIGPELEGDHFQSDPSAPPVEDCFTEGE